MRIGDGRDFVPKDIPITLHFTHIPHWLVQIWQSAVRQARRPAAQRQLRHSKQIGRPEGLPSAME
jgi:hypothetical protein